MSINSKDLDSWAKALGVSNDTDAIAAVRKEYLNLTIAGAQLGLFYKRVTAAGVASSDAILTEVSMARAANLRAMDAMDRLRRAFERHQRGAA